MTMKVSLGEMHQRVIAWHKEADRLQQQIGAHLDAFAQSTGDAAELAQLDDPAGVQDSMRQDLLACHEWASRISHAMRLRRDSLRRIAARYEEVERRRSTPTAGRIKV
jgi:hypothetical protein